MTTIEEMEEFVNWDNAGPSLDIDPALIMAGSITDINNDAIDLVFENVNEDDFGFLALQHFSSEPGAFQIDNMIAPVDPVAFARDLPPELWTIPDSPCLQCADGGYLCKKIQEGLYKGYCTGCVALCRECSFSSSSAADEDSATLPPNPWPVMGDHPNPIPQAFNPAGNQDHVVAPKSAANAKIGARFSRESVRILKNWLSTHTRHPYPSDEEKEMLQRQTGLNKTQITNWLANARRRGKILPPRSVSPHVRNLSGPIDIPARRGTPALESMRRMDPLQRWVDSPPENEPASVSAIARAVASNAGSSSGLNSPFSYNFTDDGSNKSLCNQSSTSSLGTSHSSGGSFASAYSYTSRNSLGSFGSFGRGRRRRRRRAPKREAEAQTNLNVVLKTYQCTFCTETFRTKHDWQRHEKSLHLSLERWVCAPDGPKALNPENNKICCIFCGEVEPDDAHIEAHNHSGCQERTLEERTFYRKDHLNQHLRLVHDVKFMDWSMKSWKVATPEIRSRCGFCGIVMDTWTIRVDHLAEHFKTGKTMAEWKGDWGFDAPVLDMVENSIPPCMRPLRYPVDKLQASNF
jgi:hypothetical protein